MMLWCGWSWSALVYCTLQYPYLLYNTIRGAEGEDTLFRSF